MLEYRMSQKTLERFLKTYENNIEKITDERVFLRCILPGHQDNKQSAVLYPDTGIYNCAVCGASHISGLLDGVEFTPRKAQPKPSTYRPLYLPTGVDYILSDTTLHMVNRNASGTIVGHSWRISTKNGRIYGQEGEIGFRLQAPILCESSSDAVALLEKGIDAGSIQSVNNWRKVQQHQIYILQYDKPGIACAAKVKGIVYRWENYGYKDIRELPEELFEELCSNLNKYRR